MYDPAIDNMIRQVRSDSGLDVAPDIRLDQAESRFFVEQLISVDNSAMKKVYATLMGKRAFPRHQNLQPWSDAMKYREVTAVGRAKSIRYGSDDIPMIQVSGTEIYRPIEPIGVGYYYTFSEIKNAARTGTPLETERSTAARDAVEQLLDRAIAYGNPSRGTTAC